jgi:Zn-dependent protease
LQLFNLDFFGKPLVLEASMAGWQQLSWGGDIISQVKTPTAATNSGNTSHRFTLQQFGQQHHVAEADQHPSQQLACELVVNYHWQPLLFQYQLMVDGSQVQQGEVNQQQLTVIPAQPHNVPRAKMSVVSLASLGFKLLKSAKMIKVVLAGASLAAYSWLFSAQFALALIACLVFHEYGHIRAMQYFGMKTKGIYLIPFLGGLAVSDEKISSRWQDVAISLMGPVFGLLMAFLCLLVYWLTDHVFFAGLSAFSALLNLFNLLPILPLDGGHVLKSISFSMHSKIGLGLCVGAAIIGVYISYALSLSLLGFLLIIGTIEILSEWKNRYHTHLIPLDQYGQVFSALWYFATIAGLIAIILYFAGSGDAILGLPLQVLQS